MGSMKRIAMDIDGVLADFNSAFADLLRAEGAALTLTGEPDRWFWFEHYGATKAQSAAAWHYMEQHPEWLSSLRSHDDFRIPARMKLADLCDRHEVTFVTSRGTGREETATWLEQQLPYTSIHVVLTPRAKSLALIAMQPDVIVEDCLSTLQSTPLKCLKLLVNRAYNQSDCDEADGITRVGSTLEALERIEQL